MPLSLQIVIDYHQFKLDLAKTIGAHHVYNLSDLSAPEILSRIVAEVVTDGRGGPDVYFECTGNPSSIPQGLSLVRKCGTFCHVGICKQPDCCADWNAISAGKELTVIGSNLGYGCWDRAFDIVASGVMDPIVTHAYTLEEYIDALELVQDPIDCIKVIVDPTVERSGLTEWGKKIVPKDLADGSARKEKMAKELAEKEKSSADSMGRLDGYSLEGKVVLITGASAGIGEACARGRLGGIERLFAQTDFPASAPPLPKLDSV